jgi:hypothetical protein
MDVELDIDPRLGEWLVGEAERRGCRVDDLIREAIHQYLGGRPWTGVAEGQADTGGDTAQDPVD